MSVPFRVAFRRLFAARLLGTVSLRFAYPFLPTIADGLGTDLATIGVGVAGGEIAGLLAPVIGRRLDRVGRRRGMIDGLVVSAAGCVGVAAAPHVAVFGIALFFVAIGRYLYDVSFGAWVGDEVPFERRGRAIGLGELAWSGAFLIGVPVAGLIASATSWRVPYLLSAAILLASIPVVRATLEPKVARARNTTPEAGNARPTWLHVAVFALSLGAALFFVTEGAFFETDLGMSDACDVECSIRMLGGFWDDKVTVQFSNRRSGDSEVEVPMAFDDTWDVLKKRLEAKTGIPASQIELTCEGCVLSSVRWCSLTNFMHVCLLV